MWLAAVFTSEKPENCLFVLSAVIGMYSFSLKINFKRILLKS